MLHVMGIVNHQSLPSQAQTQAKGLYDAAHEHDACGVGMVEIGRASCRERV